MKSDWKKSVKTGEGCTEGWVHGTNPIEATTYTITNEKTGMRLSASRRTEHLDYLTAGTAPISPVRKVSRLLNDVT